MLVSEILRIKGNALFTAPPNGSVLEAVKVMAQHDIGSLVVMDHGRMVGMLTFAEVLEALAKRNGALGDLKVGDILVNDPLTATTGLDVMASRTIVTFIRECRDRGKTVIFSTHVMSEVEKLCDMVGIIQDGKLLDEGTLPHLREKYGDADLEEIFVKIVGPYHKAEA